ncbi:hypothetical protein AHF37_05731 [Paragonimus kellicotti]|nr:hypothetical protein AHF37_05731 [Paragonimus kellicotti]
MYPIVQFELDDSVATVCVDWMATETPVKWPVVRNRSLHGRMLRSVVTLPPCHYHSRSQRDAADSFPKQLARALYVFVASCSNTPASDHEAAWHSAINSVPGKIQYSFATPFQDVMVALEECFICVAADV